MTALPSYPPNAINPPRLDEAKRVVVAVSGGKDSVGCIYTVQREMERQGVELPIELWHHDVDGKGIGLFDWPCTPAYVRRLADDLGLPCYFSWKVGGIEREMLRKDAPTAPTEWDRPDGTIGKAGGKGKPGTRLKFPQVTASLTTRWCTALTDSATGR